MELGELIMAQWVKVMQDTVGEVAVEAVLGMVVLVAGMAEAEEVASGEELVVGLAEAEEVAAGEELVAVVVTGAAGVLGPVQEEDTVAVGERVGEQAMVVAMGVGVGVVEVAMPLVAIIELDMAAVGALVVGAVMVREGGMKEDMVAAALVAPEATVATFPEK
ncbi:hypothetical protein ACLOJK_030526 [Asimina triloba]